MKISIVVRTDLQMGKGKMCAQVGHASVVCALDAYEKDPIRFAKWMISGQKKVVLKVASLEELEQIEEKAKAKGVFTFKVVDFGLTQIEPNSITVLGLGPDNDGVLDELVGHLKLL